MMNVGELNKRILIERKSVTRAPNGEELIAWVPVTSVWAKVAPIRGREFFSAAQMQSAVDYRVTIRYRSGLDRTMRVVFGPVVMDIVADPINVNSNCRWLELMCVAGVRDG